ncbi:glycine reductase [Lactobacillus colini]|uniref:Glycine reductase n=1 Tax=Lactobacillus colini TaxID=1819254 RepID=A0ABS4MBP3_9LACO|nr:GrdB-related putative oxidoreductase [Lactobacillus colini]MBP2057099.1 glycine reductase [Lactobacillus colini]
MKVIIILDQIQAGLGGKEKSDTPLGGKKIAMGSSENIEKLLEKHDSKIIGTFYCGTDYYQDNKAVVQRKFVKMAEKMGADVVITGPSFDYHDFSQMALELAEKYEEANVPVISAIAKEKNQDLIDQYREKLLIVKMPKKGGSGLSEALDNLVTGCLLLANKRDTSQFKQDYCY